MKVFIGFEAPQHLVNLHQQNVPMLMRYLGGRHPTGHQPLHLTVKAPFEIDEPQIEPLIQRLEGVAEYGCPFDVRIRPVSHFDGSFIHRPLDGAVLRDTIEQVLALLEDFGVPRGEFDGKTPHVTLVNGAMTPKQFQRAFELCLDTGKWRRGVLDTLVLYERRANLWTPYWRMPLRQQAVA